MMDSPYVIERGAGLWHLKSRMRPDQCVGCIRADCAAVLWNVAYGEGWQAALAAATNVVKSTVVGGSAEALEVR